MGLDFEYISGQTPLNEDEKEGLLIKTISTREELDEFEQVNIQQAIEWTLKNKFTRDQILKEEFILLVHKKMFSEVWEWAGAKRKSNKNIGVDKYQITTELRKLLDDCKFWIDKQMFDPDEIAIRFSHRLVQIHVFPNGNGRHSRLIADILIENVFNKPVFTWGRSDLSKKSNIRKEYLEAIYSADRGDIQPLVDFSRK
jgi:Fic-DOC domain mobile mystery protein B